MRIGLDVRWINNSGIGTTLKGLLDHLTKDQLKQITLYGPKGGELPYPCEYKLADEPMFGLKQHWSYGRRLNRDALTFFHMPHFDIPFSYTGPLVSTVYDLIQYKFPEYSTKPLTKMYSGFFLRRVASRALRIIAISEQTKRDMIQFFPKAESKITVLYPAVNKSFSPTDEPLTNDVVKGYGLNRGYVLYVGNLRESKNTPRLLRVYSALAKEKKDLPPLVLVGKNSLEGINFQRYGPSIRYLGPVPFHHLPALYTGASLFVFPSLYEGFGIPPLEAMACGVPVVVSKVASLPESCGQAASYINPHSDEELGRAIVGLLENPAQQEDLRQKGFLQARRFSWDQWAQGTWKVYEETARGLSK